MSQPSPAELLARHRAGDRAAFALLVRTHEAGLIRIARGLLGPWRRDYEDVVQEAFLRLAQKPPELPRGDPEHEAAQLASWLAKVTRNLCMDALRADKRRREREDSAAKENPLARRDPSPVEANETRAAVEAGLSTLPVDQREVLVLRLLGEKSYREIAEITGKKIGTVGWLVSVGLAALSRELEPLLGRHVSPAGSDSGV
jgi:RNA polymerase sigma-70 factor (ECF subfamily)